MLSFDGEDIVVNNLIKAWFSDSSNFNAKYRYQQVHTEVR